MESTIEGFIAVSFLLVGLSHVIQHQAWAEFFMQLHRMLIRFLQELRVFDLHMP